MTKKNKASFEAFSNLYGKGRCLENRLFEM